MNYGNLRYKLKSSTFDGAIQEDVFLCSYGCKMDEWTKI